MPETGTKLAAEKWPRWFEKLSGSITSVEEYRGDITLIVPKDNIHGVVKFLKQEHPFNVMMDLFAVDYLKYSVPMPERFAVVYNLYSMMHHDRIFLKCWVAEEDPKIDSIHDIYKAVNWFEREAWDLYGIHFTGHPNLIRILCHNDFVGHPLRKDYPSDKYQRLRTPVGSSEL